MQPAAGRERSGAEIADKPIGGMAVHMDVVARFPLTRIASEARRTGAKPLMKGSRNRWS